MTDPHFLTCGHSFEKKQIEKSLEKFLYCPLCRKTAKKEDLVPNYAMKKLISKLDI